jgi:hypothetical protein
LKGKATDFYPRASLRRCLRTPCEKSQEWIQEHVYSSSTAQPGCTGSGCNASYLGGRDRKECGLKPAWAKS